MKCAICGIQIDSVDEAIDEGWIPYVWDGAQEKDGPFCPSCSETLIQVDEDGEFVVKEEYRGKIAYLDGDFEENEPDERAPTGIVLEYCEN